jgi:hypothetical protein
MIRSKLSIKAVLVATGIGLSMAAFAGSQPAAAQSYTCPAGTYYGPVYGCPTAAVDDYDYGYYGYPTILRGQHHDDDHGFGHVGIGADGSIVHHGMGFRSIGTVGVDRGFSAAHYGGGGFGHAGGLGAFHGGGGFGGGGHR